jgi:hypothetical protein
VEWGIGGGEGEGQWVGTNFFLMIVGIDLRSGFASS